MAIEIIDIIGYTATNSIKDLFSEQPDIFTFTEETSETEWNLSHHLGCKIQNSFKWLNTDVELYKTRYGGRRPDIVIHKRNTDINYIVIEIKHRGSSNSEDINKIKEYWMYGLGYEFGCAVKVNRDLSFEVTVIHRGSEKVFSHSDVRIIAPQNIQSFQTFINQHKDVDMDELNNLVKEHYTLELPNNEV